MSLNRVFFSKDILTHVIEFIPSDSLTNGVLASVNKAFHRVFQESSDNAKVVNTDNKLFVALRDYIEADLVEKQGFKKTTDDCNDLSVDGYYMLLLHSTENILVYLFRTEGHSATISAKNFGWEDFTVSTAAEWDVYSPRMSIPEEEDSEDEFWGN